jgi:MoaA/NifB/PqqE/SkfB family radical SAM enzyme
MMAPDDLTLPTPSAPAAVPPVVAATSAASAYKAFKKKLERANVPSGALIELTHRCNFRCVHCYESNHHRTDELGFDQWVAVLDELKAGGVVRLSISGGEFLLRPDHIELLRHAKRRGFMIHLLTNASLVTADIATFWATEILPASIEVSLYGASPETYEKVTGTRKGYRQAVDGLERLKAHGFAVKVKIIAMALNVHDMEPMIALAKGLGFHYEISGKLTHRDDGSFEPLKFRVPKAQWQPFAEQYEQMPVFVKGGPDDQPCNAGRTGLVVGPNGDVYACVDMRNHPVGNLARQKLDDFWLTNDFLQDIRAVKNRDMVYPENFDFLRERTPCMAHNLAATGTLTQIAVVDPNHEPSCGA